MPGIGMRMRLSHRLEQRLEQRLQQKLASTLHLSLAQVQTFKTSGEEGTAEQKTILEHLLKDVQNSVYSDWENFHYRCMKRIKKEDRSTNIQELIEALRGIVDSTRPSLSDVQTLLEVGIYAAENHEIPKVAYMRLDDTLKSDAAKSLEDRTQLIRIGGTVQRNKGDLTATYEFLHRTANDERFSTPTNYCQLVSRVSKTAQERADAIKFVNNYFERVLEGRRTIDGEALVAGFDFVEQLHQLSKERVEDRYISDARDIFSREDYAALRARYSHTPLPVLANLVATGLSEEVLSRVDNLFSQKYLTEKTDARRRVFRSLYALDDNSQKKQVLEHMLTNFNSAEHVSKMLAHLEILQDSGNFVYFFDETDGARMIRRLNDYTINRNLQVLNLSDDYKAKIADNPERITAHNLLTMISTFGGVLISSYSDGVPLLRNITEHIVDGNFTDWRYSHDRAAVQLACLQDSSTKSLEDHVVATWRANGTSERLIGDVDALQPRINALKIIADELRTQYERNIGMYGCETLEQVASFLENKIGHITAQLRQDGTDKKALGVQKRDLSLSYELLQTILKVGTVSPESFFTLGQDIDRVTARVLDEDLKRSLGEVRKILDAPEVKNLERVRVVETDAPYITFDVGRSPVQSCQRWNERTGYNKALLAYVADSNKKLYQVLDENGSIIVRSVVRLLPFDKESPILLVERPYAARWTKDYGKALFAQIAQRALELSESLGQPVAVGTTDSRIEEIMNDFVVQYKFKLKTKNYERKLPESMNGFEYSDSLGGCLPRGSKVSAPLKYVFIAIGN